MIAATQCVWLQDILGELGFAFDSPTVVWCDNKSEINIYTNPVYIQRNKYIDIHMHYIVSLVHEEVISLQYFPYVEKIVDIFTKSFTKKTFTYMRYVIAQNDTSLPVTIFP